MSLHSITLDQLLADLASGELVPGAGSVAALVTAMAAALVAKAARVSDGWGEAAGVVAQAESLRGRVTPLAERDADVYARALEAMRGQTEEANLADALDRAAEVPLEIAAVAADVAALGALAAERGAESVHGESAGAAALAEAGARIAAHLVEVNLTAAPGDERVARARLLADEAGASARRAFRPA